MVIRPRLLGKSSACTSSIGIAHVRRTSFITSGRFLATLQSDDYLLTVRRHDNGPLLGCRPIVNMFIDLVVGEETLSSHSVPVDWAMHTRATCSLTAR